VQFFYVHSVPFLRLGLYGIKKAEPARDRRMAFEFFELSGRRALVTGSSQGIGFALAQGLAERGAEIVLNGRDAGKLDAAAAKLAVVGHKVSVASFDVTFAQAASEGVAAIEQNSGAIGASEISKALKIGRASVYRALGT
jgi:hypothetical protein